MITAKGPTGGVTAMIDNASTLEIKSVRIDDQGGFSGSYLQGLQGQADVEMIGNTYKITGVAEGFTTGAPAAKATKTFSIKIAC